MQPFTTPSSKNWRLNAIIARSVGIVAIALGFVLGMYGPRSSQIPLASDRTWVAGDRHGGPWIRALLFDQGDAAAAELVI
jgi:hypothetical protein